MVYQSVVDMGASFFMVLHTVIKVDGTHMSRKSSYDQFVCLVWLGRQPLWYFMTESTYGILLMALDRYFAVLHPLWYKNNVRVLSVSLICRYDCLTYLRATVSALMYLVCPVLPSMFCWIVCVVFLEQINGDGDGVSDLNVHVDSAHFSIFASVSKCRELFQYLKFALIKW